MTTLDAIKQRDAALDWPYIERREDAYGVARGTLTSDAVRDRRWLLARVEELETLLRNIETSCNRYADDETDEAIWFRGTRDMIRAALASLTEPVSPQEVKS